MTEAVSVEGDTIPVVTTNTMEKAFLVDRTQMAELPMNGRELHLSDEHDSGHEQRGPDDFNVNFNDVLAVPLAGRARI